MNNIQLPKGTLDGLSIVFIRHGIPYEDTRETTDETTCHIVKDQDLQEFINNNDLIKIFSLNGLTEVTQFFRDYPQESEREFLYGKLKS